MEKIKQLLRRIFTADNTESVFAAEDAIMRLFAEAAEAHAVRLQAELKKPLIVYVITMYRYGDHEKHSYVAGVYADVERAKKFGADEEVFRGGKYKYEIVPFVLNDPKVDPVKVTQYD